MTREKAGKAQARREKSRTAPRGSIEVERRGRGAKARGRNSGVAMVSSAIRLIRGVGRHKTIHHRLDAARTMHGHWRRVGASHPPLQQQLPETVDVVRVKVGEVNRLDSAGIEAHLLQRLGGARTRVKDKHARAGDHQRARARAPIVGEGTARAAEHGGQRVRAETSDSVGGHARGRRVTQQEQKRLAAERVQSDAQHGRGHCERYQVLDLETAHDEMRREEGKAELARRMLECRHGDFRRLADFVRAVFPLFFKTFSELFCPTCSSAAQHSRAHSSAVLQCLTVLAARLER